MQLCDSVSLEFVQRVSGESAELRRGGASGRMFARETGDSLDDVRRDYAILVSLLMREEAEVMASALRAEGIDAFVSPLHHATYNWHLTLALGGLQVFVPRQKLQEAKDVIRARIKEAEENPEGEPVGRRDRWKVWAVILGAVGSYAFYHWVDSTMLEHEQTWSDAFYADMAERERLRQEEREAKLEYCRRYPGDYVVLPGHTDETPCRNLLGY